MLQTITCKAAVAWEAGKPLTIEDVEVEAPKKDEVRCDDRGEVTTWSCLVSRFASRSCAYGGGALRAHTDAHLSYTGLCHTVRLALPKRGR